MRRGRYSFKKKRRRGGRNRKRKGGFLSETDFNETEEWETRGEEAALAGETTDGGETVRGAVVEEGLSGGKEQRAGTEETSREEEEDTARRTTRKKKTRTRRRANVTTVEGGKIFYSDPRTTTRGGPSGRNATVWPRREGIITPELVDPNRNIVGYRAQEFPVANARTSGVFWNKTKTQDKRRFPKAMEKTLQRQGLESVSIGGTCEEEGEDDPLLWPGVRPPDIDVES